jgi:hypothetical protein
MKIVKYLGLALVLALTASCEKHEIEYKTTPLSSEMAEFQLHYVVPVASTSTNYMYKVEVNDSLLTNSYAPLTTYNAIPKGNVGRFYTVETGTVNIKMYMGTALTLKYDQDVTLTAGKQNVFVYDYNLPPKVFDNGYPYAAHITSNTDTLCYVKFYNFLYESAGVPTTYRLQYQYVNSSNALVNIGAPVSFSETTGWQPVKIVKSKFNSSGYATLTYKIKVIDTNGNIVGDLSIMNAKGVYANYSDVTKTEYIGKRYHHVIGGIRTSSSIVASVSEFAAL